MNVWIARDYNGYLYLFDRKPVYCERCEDFHVIQRMNLPTDWYPDIDVGETRRFELRPRLNLNKELETTLKNGDVEFGEPSGE